MDLFGNCFLIEGLKRSYSKFILGKRGFRFFSVRSLFFCLKIFESISLLLALNKF